MGKPHKHSELIKLWADGAEIQYKNVQYGWITCSPEGMFWDVEGEYRIKPEPKPDCVSYAFATKGGSLCWAQGQMIGNLKLTFDGETGKLKSAEVLK